MEIVVEKRKVMNMLGYILSARPEHPSPPTYEKIVDGVKVTLQTHPECGVRYYHSKLYGSEEVMEKDLQEDIKTFEEHKQIGRA